MTRKRLSLLLVALVVIGAVVLVVHKKAVMKKAPRYTTRPLPVRVAEASVRDLAVGQDYLAVVEANETAELSARLLAEVVEVAKDEGDPVKKDEVLLRLDDREIVQALNAVEARIEAAKAELEANEALVASLKESAAYWKKERARDEALAREGAVSASVADRTRDQWNKTEGQLESAVRKSGALRHEIEALRNQRKETQVREGYTRIRSPFDGVVAVRYVDPGDLAAPGTRLFQVEDRQRKKLAFDVPQEDLPFIRKGLPVTYNEGGKARQALIDRIFPSLAQGRLLRVEAHLPPDSGWNVGAYVPARIVKETRKKVVVVPGSCILEGPDGAPSVFIVKDGGLEVRKVKRDVEAGGLVEVEGVQAGEQVVESTFYGWATLSQGLKVEVIP